jgi:hypothetical protein
MVTVMIISMQILEILTLFDQYLARCGLRFDAMVVGGAAPASFNSVSRLPRDFHVLHPEIPKEIADASRSFATEVRQKGKALGDDWLNNGSIPIINHLQPQWDERLQTAFVGSSIHLLCLGRSDVLCAKLFVLCDCGVGLNDCLALAPSVEDLDDLLPWLEQQHASPFWPEHVRTIFAYLETKLGYGTKSLLSSNSSQQRVF